MKILIVANDDAGLYQFRRELICELLKKHDVYISLPYGKLVENLKEDGCKYIETRVDRRGINPITDLFLFLKYLKIITKLKPDLVITYTIKPNIYAGLSSRLLKIPYAINITGLGTAFEKDSLLKKLVILMYKVSCKDAKVVFFENEENKQIFIDESIIDKSQAFRLNGAGVNLEKFKLLDYPKFNKTIFLFMGRIMAEKGVNELFEATKRLVDDGINCELDVLGYYEEDYENTIKKYENEGWLKYYGYQSDVRPFIEKCHCFVLPSWHEGMANTNLECAASGRPVITSNIFGCKEAVEDSVTGYLIEKKNSESLYNAMKKFTMLSYNEKLKMGYAGRKRMEKVFDKNKVVHQTIKVLREKGVTDA